MSWDIAQWFDSLGPCRKCGKKATGKLMDHRNSNIGAFCDKCAEALIKQAHRKHKKFHPDVVVEPSDA